MALQRKIVRTIETVAVRPDDFVLQDPFILQWTTVSISAASPSVSRMPHAGFETETLVPDGAIRNSVLAPLADIRLEGGGCFGQEIPNSHGLFIGDSMGEIVRLYNEYRAGRFARMSEVSKRRDFI
jgi:redox-sensitive bicupin YhaK (pirin superfamily)